MTAKKAAEEAPAGKAPEAVAVEESVARAQGVPTALGTVEDEGRDANVGKVHGRDIDGTFHDYSFTDPFTGEPLEVVQTVHQVPVGVNKDGSVKTAPMTDEFAQKKT